MNIRRREFLKFIGLTAASSGLGSTSTLLSGCSTLSPFNKGQGSTWPAVKPQMSDAFITAEGIQSQILIKWNDSIGNGLKFGFNNDFLAVLPMKDSNDYFLWVNHEFPTPLFVSGYTDEPGVRKTKEQVLLEMDSVGGSLLHLTHENNAWKIKTDSAVNTRFTAQTPIPFSKGYRIEGKTEAIGTLANCAGGSTPWGHFLTCEENYDIFYGEWDYRPKPGHTESRTNPKITYPSDELSWIQYFDRPATHYGWVVEIDPITKSAKKLCALGRFAHESATCRKAKDGRTVVYMGDDAVNQHLYKFISKNQGSLEEGELFVANTETGQWLSLNYHKHPDFKKRFRNQTDLLVRTREAAKIVKATPLDRPEDIEIHPVTGDVFVSLTNNKPAGRPFGSILKIQEKDNDPLSLQFNSSVFIAGGDEAAFACPDNLVFDKKGNLWMTSDMSDKDMGKEAFKQFGNNGLFYIPTSGPHAGKAFQMASAPVDSELTGLCFAPDGETLLLCVQHPGESSKSFDRLTSHWPDGKGSIPKPAVMALSGPLLTQLVT